MGSIKGLAVIGTGYSNLCETIDRFSAASGIAKNQITEVVETIKQLPDIKPMEISSLGLTEIPEIKVLQNESKIYSNLKKYQTKKHYRKKYKSEKIMYWGLLGKIPARKIFLNE